MKSPTVCTWDINADCNHCRLHGNLNCKWKKSHLIYFLQGFLPVFILQFIPMVAISYIHSTLWPALAYILFYPVVLGVFELRFLCSHCPFYNQEGRVLHCLANHGLLKLWKFHPGPMNKFERFLMRLLVGVMFIGFPLLIYGYLLGHMLIHAELFSTLSILLTGGMFLATASTEFFNVKTFYKDICSKCVNFSCPFNNVPRNFVDAYLKRNPVMLEAWEKSGYTLN